MNRKRQQAELFFKLGQLYGPVLKMVDNPESFDSDERTRIVARFYAERGKFEEALREFAFGEPGHVYHPQFHRAADELGLPYLESDESKFYESVRERCKKIFKEIFSIPVPVDSAIHEASTPFSTYCLVKDLCSTARHRITWMDRYFDQTLFGRYFVDTPNTTLITLITLPETMCSSKKDEQRYKDFLGISRLFAQERGPTRYQLIVDSSFHDRLLRCDDKMFSLGGSIKELGKDVTFTISTLDSSPENKQYFDEAVARGKEIFGPSTTVHP